MSTLLTGAGGFLGSHLLEALLEETEQDVVCVDSFRHNGATDRIAAVAGGSPRVRVLTHDLTVPFSPRVLASLDGVQYLVHAASGCQVDQSIVDPAGFIMNNVGSTITMLEAARALDVERFVQISTDEVYGDHAWRCGTDHRPSNPYSASKAAQEDICHAYARTFGVPVTITNSSNMLGERQSQLAFTPQVVRKLLRGEVIRVHATAGVPGRRTYTYAGNTARHVVGLLRSGAPPRRHHLRGQRTLDNVELVEAIAKFADLPARFELVEAEGIRPGYDRKYHDLAHTEEWSPAVPFDAGLRRTVEWFMANQDWLEV